MCLHPDIYPFCLHLGKTEKLRWYPVSVGSEVGSLESSPLVNDFCCHFSTMDSPEVFSCSIGVTSSYSCNIISSVLMGKYKLSTLSKNLRVFNYNVSFLYNTLQFIKHFLPHSSRFLCIKPQFGSAISLKLFLRY